MSREVWFKYLERDDGTTLWKVFRGGQGVIAEGMVDGSINEASDLSWAAYENWTVKHG